MNKEIIEQVAYEKGFNKGWQKSEYANKWISIEHEAPEEERLLIYFFDMTGTSLGFYFGIDEEYCSETGHVFGGNFGWLTGDVTHWMYVPEYPEGYEDHADRNAEYARALRKDVDEVKKPIGSPKHGSLNSFS